MNQFLNETVAFYELQKFEQKFIKWAVIIASIFPFVLLFVGFYMQVVLGQQFGDKPMSNAGLLASMLISLIFGIAILFLFFGSKLETIITQSGLHVRLYPFMRYKTYAFDNIKKFKIRQYKPIVEYGGWGIRIGAKGRAFNMHGNIGLQIIFEDGKKVLIGTQEPDKLLAAFSSYVKINQE